MSTIFSISNDYLSIIADIEDEEGVLIEEIEARLRINHDELEGKAKAYHHIIGITKGQISVIDEEIERLKKLKKTRENLIERLKKYILEATLLFGVEGKSGNKVLEFDTVKFYTQNTESIIIDDKVFTDFKFTITDKLTKEDIDKIKTILGKEVTLVPIAVKDEIKEKITADANKVVTTLVPNYINKFACSEIVSDIKGVKVVKTTGIRIR